MCVIEVVAYDTKRQVEKTLWFRGKTFEEAEARRNDYFVKHIHSIPISQRYL